MEITVQISVSLQEELFPAFLLLKPDFPENKEDWPFFLGRK